MATAKLIRFIEDENDAGTERLVEYVPRIGPSFILHEFFVASHDLWVTVPGCCDDGEHSFRRR